MSVPDQLGVFFTTGVLATRLQDFSLLLSYQEELLNSFLEAEFEPQRCADLLKQMLEREPSLGELFDLESVKNGGCIASKSLLYDMHQDRSQWALAFFHPEADPIMTGASREQLPEVARLLRESLQGKPWSALSETLSEPRIVEVTASGGAEGLKWPRFEGPGIQRLEHASLLIASEQAKILIDPVALAACGPLGLSNLDQSPSNMDVAIDAMLITHSHLDHWHIPSIMRYGGDGGVPVIVPRIPFPSLLAQDDMLQSLKDVGQNALAPAWGETVRIKDIEIDILPFFGEQPTLKGPLPPENVRNWGNCYRIHTPGFSVIVLVDSGTDSLGSVEEVLKQSVARRGEPDLILSCCREMTGAPFWQGLFTFWMVLPISELQKLVRSRTGKHGPSVTMGPQGIGDACVSFKAKAFAPYANGFKGIGLEIEDIGWGDGEPPEAQVLGQIESRIAEQGGDTRVIRWLPGDVLRFDSKRRCAVSTG